MTPQPSVRRQTREWRFSLSRGIIPRHAWFLRVAEALFDSAASVLVGVVALPVRCPPSRAVSRSRGVGVEPPVPPRFFIAGWRRGTSRRSRQDRGGDLSPRIKDPRERFDVTVIATTPAWIDRSCRRATAGGRTIELSTRCKGKAAAVRRAWRSGRDGLHRHLRCRRADSGAACSAKSPRPRPARSPAGGERHLPESNDWLVEGVRPRTPGPDALWWRRARASGSERRIRLGLVHPAGGAARTGAVTEDAERDPRAHRAALRERPQGGVRVD